MTLRDGQRDPQLIGGLTPGAVDFFLDESDASYTRIGRRAVWAWPFPEVCTAAETLRISGRSSVRMGTAPDVWNVVLVAMARVSALPPSTIATDQRRLADLRMYCCIMMTTRSSCWCLERRTRTLAKRVLCGALPAMYDLPRLMPTPPVYLHSHHWPAPIHLITWTILVG